MSLNHHTYFNDVALELNQEIQYHQALLMNLLQLPKDSPIELKLGEVAAFVGIILDGTYDNDEIVELMGEILKRLRAARVELILDVTTNSKH